jgi:probable HAF family extracellular repeat protein
VGLRPTLRAHVKQVKEEIMRGCLIVQFGRFALLATGLLLASRAAAADVQTLHYPGATATVANDINDSGLIVGTYYSAGGVSHGFLYDGGSYVTIDHPDGDWSEVTGINCHGDIVGYYGRNTESFSHGFRRTAGGTFTSIDLLGQWNTMPQGINMSGVVAGCIHNPGAMFGWTLQAGAITSETRGEGWTGYAMYTGINDGGTLIGWYSIPDVIRSFVLAGSGRTDIEYPGATNTRAFGVSSLGDIVGWYGPAASSRGFLLRDGQFTQIHKAGATWTRAFGINAAGDIVGAYRDGTGTHGFLLPAE